MERHRFEREPYAGGIQAPGLSKPLELRQVRILSALYGSLVHLIIFFVGPKAVTFISFSSVELQLTFNPA